MTLFYKMNRTLAIFFFVFLFSNTLLAQQVKLWVFFKDKCIAGFCADSFFTEKHHLRNQLMNLPDFDFYDLPVNKKYIAQINNYCDSITGVSRWFNAVCVYTDEKRLIQIKELNFVSEIEIHEFKVTLSDKNHLDDLHNGEINLLKGQIDRMQGNLFKKNNITGKNITVAIIDAGFSGYLKSELVKKLRDNKQIKHTYDFIKKSNNVDCGSSHGTSVLTCIGGSVDSLNIGCAFEADFLLYRTEKAFNEKFSEEEKWVMAMEEADRQGADVINTSLGYTGRRYFEKDMNGKKSLLSRAANMANRKGMLLVCSAGNEGDIDWKIICTPADADSALAVGAINPWTGIQASWSSYGPSSDWRVKPNICAYGYVMAADGPYGVEMTLGTSFSSPLVAGFAACVKQMMNKISAYDLLTVIEHSADLFPYFDYAHGFGVPQAGYFMLPKKQPVPSYVIHFGSDTLSIIINDDAFVPAYLQIKNYHYSKEDSTYRFIKFMNEKFFKSNHLDDYGFDNTRSSFVFTEEPGYFYYKFHDIGSPEKVEEYAVLNVRKKNILKIPKKETKHNYCFYYKGYYTTAEF